MFNFWRATNTQTKMTRPSAMEVVRSTVPNIIRATVAFVSFLWRLRPVQQSGQVTDMLSLQKYCEGLKEMLLVKVVSVPEKRKAYVNELIDIISDIVQILTIWQKTVEEIRAISPTYDFSEEIRGNGYRSFVVIADKAVLSAGEILQQCPQRALRYDQTLTADVREILQLFVSLSQCFMCLQKFKSLSKEGSLHASEGISIDEMIDVARNVEQKCFYGRFLANAFDDGIRQILKLISLSMVSYSEIYYGGLSRLFRPAVYALQDSARAERHVALAHHAGVDFIQAFWAQSEHPVCMLPMKMTNPVVVNEIMAFNDPYVVLDGVKIEPSYEGSPLVLARLISSRVRQGMKNASPQSADKSRCLLIHVHGGGFVSQSSHSQEIFLRKWAAILDVPIFSIDYSLAPGARFPRPLHEVFYGYCFALANASLLGSTAERVVMVADSAGANLTLGAMLECIRCGIRLPDGLMLAYVPVLINLVPSPARLLGLMDPLLPFSIMMRCAKAYTDGQGVKDCVASYSQEACAVCRKELSDPRLECLRLPFLVSVPDDPMLSPYLAADHVLSQLPPVSLCTSTFDPCLDDTIVFAKKLLKLGVPVTLDVAEGLPHGFLNFCGLNEKAHDAMLKCCSRISALFADIS